MCKCIDQVESKTEALIKNKHMGIVQQVSLSGIAFDMDGKCRTFNEVEYKFIPIKKNGEEGRRVTKKINMYHTYCPFCGEKYPDCIRIWT